MAVLALSLQFSWLYLCCFQDSIICQFNKLRRDILQVSPVMASIGNVATHILTCMHVLSVMCLWWDWYRAKKHAWQSSSSLTAYKSVICNTLGNSTKHYYRYQQEVIVRLSKPWESCTDHTSRGFSPSHSAHTLINLGLLLKGHSRPNMNLPQFIKLCMLISAVLSVFSCVF